MYIVKKIQDTIYFCRTTRVYQTFIASRFLLFWKCWIP